MLTLPEQTDSQVPSLKGRLLHRLCLFLPPSLIPYQQPFTPQLLLHFLLASGPLRMCPLCWRLFYPLCRGTPARVSSGRRLFYPLCHRTPERVSSVRETVLSPLTCFSHFSELNMKATTILPHCHTTQACHEYHAVSRERPLLPYTPQVPQERGLCSVSPRTQIATAWKMLC